MFEIRDIEGIDKDEFERLFKISNLWEIISEHRVDEAVRKLNQKVLAVLDRLSPKKMVVINKKYAPWINHEIKADLEYQRVLHEAAQDSNSFQDWADYKRFRNQLRNKMRRAEEKITREWLNELK